MLLNSLARISFIFLVLTAFVYAQDDDLRTAVDYKINKMTTELHLTDSQADAARPIIKDYLTKRQAVLDEAGEQGIVDHVSLKSTLKGLKEREYQKLAKILSEDQMKKLINKENLMATLNPDSVDSPTDDGLSLSPTGANFKF